MAENIDKKIMVENIGYLYCIDREKTEIYWQRKQAKTGWDILTEKDWEKDWPRDIDKFLRQSFILILSAKFSHELFYTNINRERLLFTEWLREMYGERNIDRKYWQRKILRQTNRDQARELQRDRMEQKNWHAESGRNVLNQQRSAK